MINFPHNKFSRKFQFLVVILFLALCAAYSKTSLAQNHQTSTAIDIYRQALNSVFSPLFDKSLLFGQDEHCFLLFHVNEDGIIKQVQVKDCDVTGAWQQSIIRAATRLKISGKLPPPDSWEKFGVQEVLFFRSPSKGTTANPPITKLVTSIVPVDLPRATTSMEDNNTRDGLHNPRQSAS